MKSVSFEQLRTIAKWRGQDKQALAGLPPAEYRTIAAFADVDACSARMLGAFYEIRKTPAPLRHVSLLFAEMNYRRAAALGCPLAQEALADLLETRGEAGASNPCVSDLRRRAARGFSEAAGRGYPRAQNALGECHVTGRGVERSDEKAVAWFRKAAEQGYARAQCHLGECHAAGRGVERNDEEAVAWFRKAAEQGYVRAQCRLGECHAAGRGVERNDEEAVAWFRKAAEQGYAPAQNRLGECYATGRGVGGFPSWREAASWFRKAAEQGYAPAQNLLGVCYANGNGVERNRQLAVGWILKAAERGDASAQNNLGECYERWRIGNPESWFRKAAEQGHAVAQFHLAAWCVERGGRERLEEAAGWYRKAAEQGLPDAQYCLGACYEYGRGVDRNPGEAARWYRKAAGQSYRAAFYPLGRLVECGSVEDGSPEEAVRSFRDGWRLGDLNAGCRLMRSLAMGIGAPDDLAAAREILDELSDKDDQILSSSIDPDNIPLLADLACWLEGNKGFRHALPYYRFVLERTRHDAGVRDRVCSRLLSAGRDYLWGENGRPQNVKLGIELIRNAAHYDYPPAVFELGGCHETGFAGNGIRTDLAVQLYERAAGFGYGPASEALHRLAGRR